MSSLARCRPPISPVSPPRRAVEDVLLSSFVEDAGRNVGAAKAVVFPETEGEWAFLLSGDEAILPVGAQSSLTGGACPQADVVAVTAAAGAKLIVDGGGIVKAQAGLTVAALQNHLRDSGRFFPPAPTYEGAQVGGIVATNAAGARTFKYGTTRPWVEALTLALPGGDVLDIRRGECVAARGGCFELLRADGRRTSIPTPSHVLPDVPKCSAGYWSSPELDLVDLFVGSEGTLGVVLEVEFKVEPAPAQELLMWVPFADEAEGLAAVAELRRASQATWRDGDGAGIDLASIEHLDARCLELLQDRGVSDLYGLSFPAETSLALLISLELPAGSTVEDDLAHLDQPGRDSPTLRCCRLLQSHGVALGDIELALPGDEQRRERLLAFREAAPQAVGALLSKRRLEQGPGIHKVGGDLIVPHAELPTMLEACRTLADERGLDLAVWGHVSDGNLHPNVLPTCTEDVRRGEDLQLALGRLALQLGGSPLAEHGVGRHPVKQALMVELVGQPGWERMREVKAALDPEGILSRGVLFGV